LPDFSDEFVVSPVNTTRWNTSVASWGTAWSWDPANVRVVNGTDATTESNGGGAGRNLDGLQGGDGDAAAASHLAITMTYAPHRRNGMTVPYKSGILQSRLPAGVTYGHFEARIRGASLWPGVCPAFWAYRRGSHYWTELDFVEMLESDATPRDIDFTSHVFPPTPGVPKEISNATRQVCDTRRMAH